MCQLSTKILSQNKWSMKADDELANHCSPGKLRRGGSGITL